MKLPWEKIHVCETFPTSSFKFIYILPFNLNCLWLKTRWTQYFVFLFHISYCINIGSPSILGGPQIWAGTAKLSCDIPTLPSHNHGSNSRKIAGKNFGKGDVDIFPLNPTIFWNFISKISVVFRVFPGSRIRNEAPKHLLLPFCFQRFGCTASGLICHLGPLETPWQGNWVRGFHPGNYTPGN